MKNPLVSSTDRVHPLWSGTTDYTLRPTMMVVRDVSGFRPVDASELFRADISGTVSVTGIVAVDAVGITGQNGVIFDVIPNVNGRSAISVLSTQSGNWQVGVTGSNGLSINPFLVSGFNAIPVFLASGSLGSAGGSSAPAVQATKPALPNNYGTYGINLTGIGVFSNYSTIIPNVTGNPLSLTVEPDSDNGGKVYYAFSGTASTGQAYELRGDKPFDVSGTTSIFFAQVSSGNRVMVHFQVYN